MAPGETWEEKMHVTIKSCMLSIIARYRAGKASDAFRSQLTTIIISIFIELKKDLS